MSVIFTKDATVKTVRDPLFPYRAEVDLRQAQGMTAGGTQIIQGLGSTVNQFTLRFRHLTDTMRDDLASFFETTVVGASTTFTYTDPEANDFTVRWMDKTFNFVQDLEGSWSGTITLQT